MSTPAQHNAPAASPVARPAGQWRALSALAVALLLAMTTWFSATAVLPQLRAEWGVSDLVGSLLTIAVQLGFVAGSLIAALLNIPDLVPPRRLMLYGAILAAGANLLLLLAAGPGPALALPLRFLTGVGLAAVYPPSLKALATWFRVGRGAALGVLIGALTLGSALPHLINGIGGIDWQIVVVSTSALTLLGGAIAAAIPEGPFPFPRGIFDPRQARRAFSNRGVRLASLGYFGHMWELYAMWAWFSAFSLAVLEDRNWHNPTRTAALMTFAVIGIGALGCVLFGLFADRWQRPRVISASLATSGLCALLIGFLYDAPLPVILMVGLIWGFSVVADSAQFSALVTEHADQRFVGTALTLQLAVGYALTVTTIWLIPFARDHIGWNYAFALLAIGPALGITAMQRLSAPTPAATAADPSPQPEH